MNKTNIILAIVAGLVGAFLGVFIGVHYLVPLTGGDFAGGITPALHGATTTGGLTGNGYIYPNGYLAEDAANGVSVGGSDQYHGFTAYISASGTLPAAGLTLGPLGSATSTATTTIVVPETTGLAIGDICSGGVVSSSAYVSGCILTSTNGATGTASAYITDGTGAAITLVSSTRVNIGFDHLPY